MLISLIINDKAYFCTKEIKEGGDVNVVVAKKDGEYLTMQPSGSDKTILMGFQSKSYATRMLGEINALYDSVELVNMKDIKYPCMTFVDVDTQLDKGLPIIQAIYDEIHNNAEYSEFYYENASLFATVMGPVLACRYDDETDVAKTIVNTVYSFCRMYAGIVESLAKDIRPEDLQNVMQQFEEMENPEPEDNEEDTEEEEE